MILTRRAAMAGGLALAGCATLPTAGGSVAVREILARVRPPRAADLDPPIE